MNAARDAFRAFALRIRDSSTYAAVGMSTSYRGRRVVIFFHSERDDFPLSFSADRGAALSTLLLGYAASARRCGKKELARSYLAMHRQFLGKGGAQ